ncbi:flagellar basal body-associated FliL family protein [Desulfovibrio sp. OttesenSCG-928-C14]|nr:flagellar basal body-associated FliL family protein [Desulfovibrio sp. OttesenSCG-928-C14]
MAQDDEVPQKKKKSKAKWIILIFLILMLGGGYFVAKSMGLLDKFLPGSDAATQGEQAAQSGTVITTPTSAQRTASFPYFLVNLSDPAGNRYVRMTLEVEVISPEVIKELEIQNPRIRDAMIMLLSSKRFSDVSSQAGKLQLKNEILDRINQVLGGPKVSRVFFTEFVVQ